MVCIRDSLGGLGHTAIILFLAALYCLKIDSEMSVMVVSVFFMHGNKHIFLFYIAILGLASLFRVTSGPESANNTLHKGRQEGYGIGIELGKNCLCFKTINHDSNT